MTSPGEAVRALLEAAVADGTVPGAVFVTGAPGQPAEAVVTGDAQVRGGPRRPLRRDTPFDLASLTKVVATLPAVLRLAGQGELALDDEVARFLPGFGGPRRDEVTIRQLLAHTSGLPAEIRFWRRYADRGQAAEALLSVPLERPPGTATVYSDVGFMLLGRVVTAVTGAPLEASVAGLVTGPLGLTRTRRRPPSRSPTAAR